MRKNIGTTKTLKRLLVTVMVLALMLGTTVGAFAAAPTFKDIKTTNWAYKYVAELSSREAIKGYPDGTFKPSGTITVAEFVKIAVSLLDGDHQPLEDDHHWASGYMKAAEVMQITPEGMFDRTAWNKPITRQQMGVIMEKAATTIYEEETVTDQAQLTKIKNSIKDYNQICDKCKDAIVQAVSRGLIAGYSDGTFKPTNTATRAEAAAMIIRLVEEQYRVLSPENLPEAGVVREGTDINDIVKTPALAKILSKYVVKYVVLEDTSKFDVKFLSQNKNVFWIQYVNIGVMDTLDKDMNWISSDMLLRDDGVTKSYFEGQLKDTAWFLMVDYGTGTAYLMPNTLTAN